VEPRPKAPPLDFSHAPPPADSRQAREAAKVVDGDKASGSDRNLDAKDDHARDAARDDVSVPPVDLDSAFFDALPVSADSSLGIDTREARLDPRIAAKLSPTAFQRRARFARYVTAAVGLASALCVAALVKVAVARSHEELAPLRSRSTAQAAVKEGLPEQRVVTDRQPTAEPAKAPESTAAPAESGASAAASAPSPDPAAAAPAVSTETAAAAEPAAPTAEPAQGASAAPLPSAPVASAAPDGASPAPAEARAKPAEVAPAGSVEAPLDPKEAAKEAGKQKAKSRRALEWGKTVDAIAAGEQSVALDPADAEAWLILGAAYQTKGDFKSAMRSFKACVDQGKRGPKYECAAMIR
jgi:hypothetical protein